MKNLTAILLSSLFSAVFISCSKIPASDNNEFESADNGIYIINEGNFQGGTGSLSFYSFTTGKIYNDLFLKANGWPLGDVAYSMNIRGENAYIVVNNSGKIEVVNKSTLKSVKTINGLNSPRFIDFAGENKAYVTSIYSDSLTIINLTDYSISGYIDLRRTSEAISVNGNMAYIANWVGGDEIMVVNTITDSVVDSIEVGAEPESMVIDRNKMIWVLCNGGWQRNNFAELVKINTGTNHVDEEFIFPTINDSPTCLQINGTGDKLYYIERGIHQIEIESLVSVSALPLIPESGHYFYKIAINPVNSDIYATDAADYQQQGTVLCFNRYGSLLSSQSAGIIPAFMFFKLNSSYQTE